MLLLIIFVLFLEKSYLVLLYISELSMLRFLVTQTVSYMDSIYELTKQSHTS